MGNLTSHEPTIFWILKSVNFAWNPNFWMIRAYLRAANFESSSDLAPVTTILPEAKIKAVVLGSRIRIITAAKRYTTTFQIKNWGSNQILVQDRYLWIVFSITSMKCNGLEIQATIQVDSGNNVSVTSKKRLIQQCLVDGSSFTPKGYPTHVISIFAVHLSSLQIQDPRKWERV